MGILDSLEYVTEPSDQPTPNDAGTQDASAPSGPSLLDIPDVGPGRAAALREQGIETVKEFIMAPIDDLVVPMSTGLVSYTARRIVAQATTCPDPDEDILTLPGVGPRRAAALRAQGFDSIPAIREASVDEITRALARDRAIEIDQMLREQFPEIDRRAKAADVEEPVNDDIRPSPNTFEVLRIDEYAGLQDTLHERINILRDRMTEQLDDFEPPYNEPDTVSDAYQLIHQLLDTCERIMVNIETSASSSTWKREFAEMQDRIDTVADDVDEIDQRTDRLDTRETAILGALEYVIGRVERLEQQIREHTTDISDDQETWATLTQLEEHRSHLSDIDADIRSLEKQTEELAAEDDEVSDLLEELESRVTALESGPYDEERIELLQEEMQSVSASIDALESELEGLREVEDQIEAIERSLEGTPQSTVIVEGQEISTQEAIERFKQRAEDAQSVANEAKQAHADLSANVEELSSELGWLYRNTIEVNLLVDILRTVRRSFEQHGQLDQAAMQTMNQISERIVEIRESMNRGEGDGEGDLTEASDLDALSAQIEDLAKQTEPK